MTEAHGFAEAVTREMTAPLESLLDQVPQDARELTEEQQKSIFEKIRFTWRPEDEQILVRIKAHVDEEFARNSAASFAVVDKYYAQIRVPKMEMRGGDWMPVLDHQRRQMWEMDETGHPKEDWSQVTGQDLEEALMNLERIRLVVSPRISWLLAQAVYAKYASGDYHDDSYSSVAEGTISDRNAKANRVSRPDRYHAFVRWAIWQSSKDFYDEIGRFMEYLSKMRNWKSFER